MLKRKSGALRLRSHSRMPNLSGARWRFPHPIQPIPQHDGMVLRFTPGGVEEGEASPPPPDHGVFAELPGFLGGTTPRGSASETVPTRSGGQETTCATRSKEPAREAMGPLQPSICAVPAATADPPERGSRPPPPPPLHTRASTQWAWLLYDCKSATPGASLKAGR
jgi:hypothetical protein